MATKTFKIAYKLSDDVETKSRTLSIANPKADITSNTAKAVCTQIGNTYDSDVAMTSAYYETVDKTSVYPAPAEG